MLDKASKLDERTLSDWLRHLGKKRAGDLGLKLKQSFKQKIKMEAQ